MPRSWHQRGHRREYGSAIAEAIIAPAIDKESRCVADSILKAVAYILLHFSPVAMTHQIVTKAFHLESDQPGKEGQVVNRRLALVREEHVSHLPQHTLLACRFGCRRRYRSLSMCEGNREMTKDKLYGIRVFIHQAFQHRTSHSSIWTFKICVLKDGNMGI